MATLRRSWKAELPLIGHHFSNVNINREFQYETGTHEGYPREGDLSIIRFPIPFIFKLVSRSHKRVNWPGRH